VVVDEEDVGVLAPALVGGTLVVEVGGVGVGPKSFSSVGIT
jgi:hypothetical protein